ncbi:MAG: ATP-binding protein [Alphaproteobacteria bacterium]
MIGKCSRAADRLGTRVVWAVVAVVVLSQAVSLGFFYIEGLDSHTRQHATDLGTRVAAAVGLLEGMPEESWPALLAAMSGTGMSATVETSPPETMAPFAQHRAERLIIEEISRRLPSHGGTPLVVYCRLSRDAAERSAAAAATLDILDALHLHDLAGTDQVSIGLRIRGDRWLRVTAIMTSPHEVWSVRYMASLIGAAVAAVALAAWLTRRLTAPLARIAAAAETVGLDDLTASVAEDGPEEVRRLAQAINRMQARLRTVMGERLHLMAAIAHDYGTLITRIRLRGEALAGGEALGGEDRRFILRDLDLMKDMVSTTLAFVRGQGDTEAVELVDLADLVQTVCDERTDAGDAITYRGPDRLKCRCQPVAMVRAVSNLIGNAVKYAGRADVSLENAGDTARIVIEDDGPGIPEAEFEKVFEPFYRVDKARSLSPGGVGLGLAIARDVLRRHGGDVTLANREGGGLRASALLPLAT